jgi:D-glycero-D-manno-heptose 1,7-bisphosphate phosphatase
MPPARAVFLDRDGVLIADVHHLTSVDQLRLLPRVPEGLARLHRAGWRLIMATNQSVVARGWITEERLGEIHRALDDMLRARGAEIDAVYYCPHHPEGAVPAYRLACDCRKPNPGMLVRAAEEWRLDLGASVIVGNAASDIEAGRRAGCRTVLIRAAPTDGGATEEVSGPTGPLRAGDADYIARDLEDAAGWIIAHLSRGERSGRGKPGGRL